MTTTTAPATFSRALAAMASIHPILMETEAVLKSPYTTRSRLYQALAMLDDALRASTTTTTDIMLTQAIAKINSRLEEK